MTNTEMTEIFAVMLLAWPNAETFKGGIAKLGPTIKLWASCTKDIDFWTGQQAVVRLCKECKHPPTISEFRAAAEAVDREIQKGVKQSWERLRLIADIKGDVSEYLQSLPDGCETKAVVAAMGGPDALVIEDGRGRLWNYDGFRDAYIALIRKDPALAGGTALALPGGGKERL